MSFLGLVLLFGFLAQQRLALELDHLHIAGSREISQLSRQQIIAGITVGDLYDLAGAAESSMVSRRITSIILRRFYSVANGSRAMFRAFLIASLSSR